MKILVLIIYVIFVFTTSEGSPLHASLSEQKQSETSSIGKNDTDCPQCKGNGEKVDERLPIAISLQNFFKKLKQDHYLKDIIYNKRKFPRYAEIKTYIDNLAKNYSDILKNFTIGKSYEGREILCVKISTGLTSNGSSKSAILIDAGIHAREWISVSSALYAIEQLVEYPTNQHMLEKVDVYVIPVLNPDGYEFTQEYQFDEERKWRKSRSGKGDCMGVDLNRNFEINWSANYSDPCDEEYSGAGPMSEPESQALANLLKLHNGTLKVYLSLHSYGNFLINPLKQVPNRSWVHNCTAVEAIKAMTAVRNSWFRIEENGQRYLALGMSTDYAIANGGVDLAVTFELGNEMFEFEQPAREIEPVGREFMEGLKVYVGYVEGKICQEVQ